MPRSRLLALAIVGVACAACSSHAAPLASTESPGASAGPVGCLDPRVPAPLPAGGWLPDGTGASDYEPENAGASDPPSAPGTQLASRVRRLLGGGFGVSASQEYDTARCVVDRDVALTDGAGDLAFLRVFQLRQPLNDGSFPLAGSDMRRRQVAHGSVLLTNHADDNSLVTVVLARADGLVVELQVRSSTGQDTSGWPTTMATLPPVRPAVASPVTVDRAAVVTEDVAALAASPA